MPCFAQTGDRRLEETETDISLLKRIVREQDRRIADLEKTVKALQAAVSAASAETPPADGRANTPAKLPVAKAAIAKWQNPKAWAQIQEGLSRAQVEAILGKPASVESVLDYQTLVYKNDASAPAGPVGSVKLTDDRVAEVNPPDF